MAEESVGSSERIHRPEDSDPTALTTAALLRETSHLSDRIDLKIEGVVKALEARLDAIDLATRTFQDNLVRVPTDVTKAIVGEHAVTSEMFATVHQRLESEIGLRNEKLTTMDQRVGGVESLTDERFQAIQLQFRERDVRVEQGTKQSEVAISAALQAAKEAVAEQNRSSALAIQKSETATLKQIDGMATFIQSATQALKDNIDDVKSRLTRIEAQALGRMETKQETNTSSHFMISVIAIGLAVLTFLSRFIDFGGKP